MQNYFQKSLRNCLSFRGRARRREFWIFAPLEVLLSIVVAIVAFNIDSTILSNHQPKEIETIIFLATMALIILPWVPLVAVFTRRMHDINLSGWYAALLLVPFFGALIVFIFTLIDSNRKPNKNGISPKYGLQTQEDLEAYGAME